jgi:hypothetical protein
LTSNFSENRALLRDEKSLLIFLNVLGARVAILKHQRSRSHANDREKEEDKDKEEGRCAKGEEGQEAPQGDEEISLLTKVRKVFMAADSGWDLRPFLFQSAIRKSHCVGA